MALTFDSGLKTQSCCILRQKNLTSCILIDFHIIPSMFLLVFEPMGHPPLAKHGSNERKRGPTFVNPENARDLFEH